MNVPPVTFEPIFQPYLWGGRRLAEWFAQAPADGPIAEAWLVSDEAKFPSRVSGGPFAGQTLREIVLRFGSAERFPLLLKLLDARDHLSVQVHPNDEQAARLGAGQCGKTEAWVVLRAESGSRIYAGLRAGVDEAEFRRALSERRVTDVLHSFTPRAGDCIFLPAGTVHAVGAGLLLFEIQQTSDTTYRLHDWDRVDPKTGAPRDLHVAESLACIDFSRGPVRPVEPLAESLLPVRRERLVACPYFRLWRMRGERPFPVGEMGECRIVVAVEGRGELRVAGELLLLRPGAVWLLPAAIGAGECRPDGSLTVLECGLP